MELHYGKERFPPQNTTAELRVLLKTKWKNKA